MDDQSKINRNRFKKDSNSLGRSPLERYFESLLSDGKVLRSSKKDITKAYSHHLNKEERGTQQTKERSSALLCSCFEILQDDSKTHSNKHTAKILRSKLKNFNSPNTRSINRWDCDEQHQLHIKNSSLSLSSSSSSWHPSTTEKLLEVPKRIPSNDDIMKSPQRNNSDSSIMYTSMGIRSDSKSLSTLTRLLSPTSVDLVGNDDHQPQSLLPATTSESSNSMHHRMKQNERSQQGERNNSQISPSCSSFSTYVNATAEFMPEAASHSCRWGEKVTLESPYTQDYNKEIVGEYRLENDERRDFGTVKLSSSSSSTKASVKHQECIVKDHKQQQQLGICDYYNIQPKPSTGGGRFLEQESCGSPRHFLACPQRRKSIDSI